MIVLMFAIYYTFYTRLLNGWCDGLRQRSNLNKRNSKEIAASVRERPASVRDNSKKHDFELKHDRHHHEPNNLLTIFEDFTFVKPSANLCSWQLYNGNVKRP